MTSKKDIMLSYGNVFSERFEYYRQEWHDHYADIISLVPDNSSVLDIGCGNGVLLQHLQRHKSCQVMGVEISTDAVRMCNRKGIDAIEADVELNDIPGRFDIVILSAVLEHLIDPVSVLKKLQTNLYDSGAIIIGVPNFSHLIARFHYVLGKNVKTYSRKSSSPQLGLQPYVHIQFFNKPTLEHLLIDTGYVPIGWKFLKYPRPDTNLSSSPLAHIVSLMKYTIYKLNHQLFSLFLTVKATKNILAG